MEKHKGILPIILMTYIHNGKYIMNLKKQELYYNKVQEEIWNRRRFIQYLSDKELTDYCEKELYDWVKLNRGYEEIIK